MYCEKCGTQNGENAGYCAKCGSALGVNAAAVVTAERPAGGFAGFMKKRWFIVVPALAAVIALLVCLGGIVSLFSPSYAVFRAAGKTLSLTEKRFENSSLGVFKVLADCLDKGSFGCSFDYDDGYGTEASGDLTLQSDAAGRNYGLLASISADDTDLDLTACFNKDRVALQSSLVDDGFYGITYATFDKDIEKFADTADLDEETVDMLTACVRYLEFTMNTDYREMTVKYEELFTDFLAGIKPRKTTETIFTGGGNTRCSVISYAVTEDELAGLLRDFYKMLTDDDELREYYVSSLEATGGLSSGFMYGYSGYDYGYDYGYDTPDYEQQYDDMLDSLGDSIDSFEDGYAGTLTMSFYLNGGRLVRLGLSGDPEVSGEQTDMDLYVDFGRNPDKDDITLGFTVNEGGYGGVGFTAALMTEEARGVCTDTLELRSDGDTVSFVSEWSKKSGDLTLTLDTGYETYELDARLKYTGKSFTLALEDVLEYGSLDLTFTGQKGVSVPNPKYVNLDKWDEDLLDKLEDAADGLSGY